MNTVRPPSPSSLWSCEDTAKPHTGCNVVPAERPAGSLEGEGPLGEISR